MVHFTRMVAVASVAFGAANAIPLQRRIAQVITEATADWEQACIKAGGGQQCNPISQEAFGALLAAPPPCAQQDAADKMVTLAKTLNKNAEMIRLAQLYVQQPRNAPDSLQVPYCQQAPKNNELAGLFHCQFASSKFPQFSGDQKGNLPLGVTAVNPPGSCPAKPDGPVPDGQQLNKIVTNPGKGNAGNAAAAPPATPAATQAAAAAPAAAPAAPASGFALNNGKDAIALNEKFASLTADSPCNAGENACVGGQFAQCVNGKFAVTGCSGGLKCFALPLVNSRGTSITCDTEADANARIAATGAIAKREHAEFERRAAFTLANGQKAKALNAKFATLSENSPCTSGENACVGGKFAQCANGKFVTFPCAAGLTCKALPLVNSPGTSITCDTEADANARIAATGA